MFRQKDPKLFLPVRGPWTQLKTGQFVCLHEWDIAAGVLLVQEAGGVAMDSHKRPMSFNQPKTEVHGVIAARPGARESIEFLMNTMAIEEATQKQAGESS